MSQIDLTPTVAHLLGVPIPFGNLGKLPPHLFAALAVNSSTRAADSPAIAWLSQYAAALHANAQQVIHLALCRFMRQQDVATWIIHQCCGAATKCRSCRSSSLFVQFHKLLVCCCLAAMPPGSCLPEPLRCGWRLASG
jgi:hypothetical protein